MAGNHQERLLARGKARINPLYEGDDFFLCGDAAALGQAFCFAVLAGVFSIVIIGNGAGFNFPYPTSSELDDLKQQHNHNFSPTLPLPSHLRPPQQLVPLAPLQRKIVIIRVMEARYQHQS